MNYWIELYRLRDLIDIGDYVYWRKELFKTSEWATIMLQYGIGPMLVNDVYWESVLDDYRLEVADSNGHLIVGVDPTRVRKVGEDFLAT